MNYYNNQEAFDKICGDCAGLDMNKITENDVRTQGEAYGVDEEWIEAALRGLQEYQEEK